MKKEREEEAIKRKGEVNEKGKRLKKIRRKMGREKEQMGK